MKNLVFATHNEHKLKEIRQILDDNFQVSGLTEMGLTEEIPETADTLDGNALQKARYVAARFPGMVCISDDTGLEVAALDGAPGVYTARYAGPECSPADNIRLLLHNLEGCDDRRATFRTVIALVDEDGTEHTFEGRVEGEITRRPAGCGGFGYDPVFRPLERTLTFAELPAEDKNSISHRGRATARLVEFLANQSETHLK